MHTATRLAVPLIRAWRAANPAAHVVAFGLYAPLNREMLRSLGVDSVIGGEFEAPLAEIATALAAGGSATLPEGPAITLAKQRFRVPERRGLPPLSDYAWLTMPDGSRRVVGYTEASRGCKHLCRHCPVVPVYQGRFFVVQRDMVLADVGALVAAGARHITFGDPDFFNGTGHARAVVAALHEAFPTLSYDVTIKIEHLVRHADLLALLAETGCLFVTSAVESVDDETLARLDKGHTRADFIRAAGLCRAAGLVLSPTFIPFSPWQTLEGYRDLLETIAALGLIGTVAPVQLAIRLLIPRFSRLLDLPEIRALVGAYDEAGLCYPWRHADRQVDRLAETIDALVQEGAESGMGRAALFERIAEAAGIGRRIAAAVPVPVPEMSEPWYCCAEPMARQRDAY